MSDPDCSSDCTYSHHGFHTVDCGRRPMSDPGTAPTRAELIKELQECADRWRGFATAKLIQQAVDALSESATLPVSLPAPPAVTPDQIALVVRLRDSYAAVEGHAQWLSRAGMTFAETADALTAILAALSATPTPEVPK